MLNLNISLVGVYSKMLYTVIAIEKTLTFTRRKWEINAKCDLTIAPVEGLSALPAGGVPFGDLAFPAAIADLLCYSLAMLILVRSCSVN